MPKIGRVTSARRSGFTTESAAKMPIAIQITVSVASGVPVAQVSHAAPAARAMDHARPLARWYASAPATPSAARIVRIVVIVMLP